MYHDKPRKNKKEVALRTIAILFAVCAFSFAIWRFYLMAARDMNAQVILSVKQAVLNAAVQCYSVEGVYPQSLAELEKSYGVRINHDKFMVSYDAFASNVLPDITVRIK